MNIGLILLMIIGVAVGVFYTLHPGFFTCDHHL